MKNDQPAMKKGKKSRRFVYDAWQEDWEDNWSAGDDDRSTTIARNCICGYIQPSDRQNRRRAAGDITVLKELGAGSNGKAQCVLQDIDGSFSEEKAILRKRNESVDASSKLANYLKIAHSSPEDIDILAQRRSALPRFR